MEEMNLFRQLIDQLIRTPDIPFGETSIFSKHDEIFAKDDRVFDSYCRKAIELIRTGQIDSGVIEDYLQNYRLIASGDAMDYVTDLLRIISKEVDDIQLQKKATEEHLKVLAEESFSLLRQSRKNDDTMLRKARRAAQQGLKIIDATTEYAIDPDVHGDLLLAMGQTFARVESMQDVQLSKTLKYYLDALKFKKEADNIEDFLRLQELIKQILNFLLPMTRLAGVVGQGATLENMEFAHKAAQQLDDPGLTYHVTVALGNMYSKVRQPQLAEKLFSDLLSTSSLAIEQQDGVRLALASSLSEQGRAAEAAGIQESLINENSPLLADPYDGSTLWMNYGNSLRLLGNLNGVNDAFSTAMDFTSGIKEDIERKNRELHIHGLIGEIWFLLGEPERGEKEFKIAEALFEPDLSGTDILHFHSLAGRCYFGAKMYDSALPHLDSARQILRQQLEQGPSPDVWESMLNEWSYLDALTVEFHLSKQTDEATESALVIAEAAKGRLLTWFRWMSLEEAPHRALLPDRQQAALKKVRTWAAEKPGRKIISLFAHDRGLAVFVVGEGGSLSGMWIEEAKYQEFMTDHYEPWENLIDESMVDSRLWNVSNSMTEFLLEKIGEWLWRSYPRLVEGGDDIILIPHRLFRSLPLSHCKFPGGIRLSECFKRVMISPSLYDLSMSLEAHDKSPDGNVVSLVDPDGTLPFARLEGILTTDTVKTGDDVTVDAIHKALSMQGVILISCHGDFREDDPWQSEIRVSDGKFKVYELIQTSYKIKADLVVLGVCEAARTRRSLSDEPLGFPGVLVQGGVKAVLAPMWKVDDFSSLLFLTRFFTQIGKGIHPASATQETARWMRELKSSEALDIIEDMIMNAEKLVSKGGIYETLSQVTDHLRHVQGWLSNEKRDSHPFRSALDWAAFQLVGFPVMKKTLIRKEED